MLIHSGPGIRRSQTVVCMFICNLKAESVLFYLLESNMHLSGYSLQFLLSFASNVKGNIRDVLMVKTKPLLVVGFVFVSSYVLKCKRHLLDDLQNLQNKKIYCCCQHGFSLLCRIRGLLYISQMNDLHSF